MRIRLAVWLGVALASCSGDPDPATLVPTGGNRFTIDSVREGYPMTGEARGWYRIERDTLFVTVERGRFQNSLVRSYGPDGILRGLVLQAGIGVPTETGWRIDAKGSSLSIVEVLRPEEEARFEELTFFVPLEPGVDLGERWLYFALVGSHTGLADLEPGRLASYMCQEENLLGPTEESRERAERMRTSYPTAC